MSIHNYKSLIGSRQKRYGRIWSPDENTALIKMIKAGKSYNHIAIHFHTTRQAVSGKVTRLRAKGLLAK